LIDELDVRLVDERRCRQRFTLFAPTAFRQMSMGDDPQLLVE
jgi:hypothetical protein